MNLGQAIESEIYLCILFFQNYKNCLNISFGYSRDHLQRVVYIEKLIFGKVSKIEKLKLYHKTFNITHFFFLFYSLYFLIRYVQKFLEVSFLKTE